MNDIKPINKGYGDAGASHSKRGVKGFNAQSGSPREDIDQNNYTLRQRARMLYMAAPVATSAIRTNRTNVIGLGLQLKSRINRELLGMSQIDAEKWQRKTEDEFALWAEKKSACDATGVNDFYSMQQLALMSWLVSGDVFVLLKQYEPTRFSPYSLRLHIIEADRIATPNNNGIISPFATSEKSENGNRIFDGVEIDKNGMIQAYYIRNNHPYEICTEKTEWTRVKAYGDETGLPNILQVMESERPEQYRGVSYLAQIIENVLQLRRYTESEQMAVLVQSNNAGFISTDAPVDSMPFNETRPANDSGEHNPHDHEYDMGPGQINVMRPGEKIDFAKPTHPTTGFDVFANAVCEQIGAATEIPQDLLMKSFNASYSASRAALLEAWKAFKMRREWFACDFCIPIYEVWMSEAVARGRIYAPGFFTSPELRAAYLGSEWIGPSQGQLDPVKEITAEILAVEAGFSTHEQSTIRLNGGQWDVNVDLLRRENERLTEANIPLADKEVVVESPLSSIIKSVIKDVIMESIKEEKQNRTEVKNYDKL
ncbi:MAG: phage portal protein [Oscillospiraceae bacterium]|nr:phage portal protein [Oscillospiraceae bacterium]